MPEADRPYSAARPPATPASCLNCGDARSGRYCSQCGQNDRNYMRALLPMLWELMREAFEVDSRFLRTLKLLLLKPGRLSAEFSRNRRAHYMSPIRLYLFTSFLFFLVLSLAVPDYTIDPLAGEPTVVVETQQSRVEPVQMVTDAEVAALKAILRPGQAQKVDDLLARPSGAMGRSALELLARVFHSPAEENDTTEVASPDANRPMFLVRASLASVVDFLHDPEAYTQQMIGNMPLAMFFLLPFLSMALALCYRRKRRYFVEHLVFAIHIQTFIFLSLGTALLIPAGTFGNWVRLFLVLAPEVYYLIALRRFYADGWIRTLIKGFIVQWLYFWVLIPGFLVALFLTA